MKIEWTYFMYKLKPLNISIWSLTLSGKGNTFCFEIKRMILTPDIQKSMSLDLISCHYKGYLIKIVFVWNIFSMITPTQFTCKHFCWHFRIRYVDRKVIFIDEFFVSRSQWKDSTLIRILYTTKMLIDNNVK